jgi:hypothetical protein
VVKYFFFRKYVPPMLGLLATSISQRGAPGKYHGMEHMHLLETGHRLGLAQGDKTCRTVFEVGVTECKTSNPPRARAGMAANARIDNASKLTTPIGRTRLRPGGGG